MPLISALRRQRHTDLREFKASLSYIVNFRIARGCKVKPHFNNNNNNNDMCYDMFTGCYLYSSRSKLLIHLQPYTVDIMEPTL